MFIYVLLKADEPEALNTLLQVGKQSNLHRTPLHGCNPCTGITKVCSIFFFNPSSVSATACLTVFVHDKFFNCYHGAAQASTPYLLLQKCYRLSKVSSKTGQVFPKDRNFWSEHTTVRRIWTSDLQVMSLTKPLRWSTKRQPPSLIRLSFSIPPGTRTISLPLWRFLAERPSCFPTC